MPRCLTLRPKPGCRFLVWGLGIGCKVGVTPKQTWSPKRPKSPNPMQIPGFYVTGTDMAILWYFNLTSLIKATQPMQLLVGFVMHVLVRGLIELLKRELHVRSVAAVLLCTGIWFVSISHSQYQPGYRHQQLLYFL